MGNRYIRSAVTCSAVIATVVYVSAFVASRQRAWLIDKSRIVPTSFDLGYDPYCWISDHEVIICRYGATDTFDKLILVNTIDRTSAPLDVLNQKFRAELANLDRVWISASPDGKWLVFTSRIRSEPTKAPRFTYIAASVDGSRSLGWLASEREPEAPIWMRDGHRWVETVGGNGQYLSRLVIHNVDGAQENSIVKLDDFVGDMVGIDAQDRGVFRFYAGMTYNGPPLPCGHEVQAFLPGAADRKSHELIVQPPDPDVDCTFIETPMSRNGRRVAWTFDYTRSDPLMQKLHRIFARIPLREERVHSLWVSGLDGSNMREVGYVPEQSADNGFTKTLEYIEWLPGDIALSYLYNNRLYVVPVN
jgi:hypothetical protein